MSDAMNCNEARDLIFLLRRDELDEVDGARVGLHLAECEACRNYKVRVVGMLDSAAASRPVEEHAFDRGSLFESIMAQAAGAQDVQAPTPAGQPRGEADVESAGVEDLAGRRRRGWIYAAVAVAACLLAVLLVPRAVDEVDSGPGAEVVERRPPDAAPGDDSAVAPLLAALETQVVGSPQVRVFASPGAKWHLDGERDLELRVESGELLVEFLPQPNTTLMVRTPHFEARVLGTVFYVSTSLQRLGVLAGKVEIAGRVVEAGQEVDGKGVLVEQASETLEGARRHVDLELHEEALEGLRAAARLEARKDAVVVPKAAPKVAPNVAPNVAPSDAVKDTVDRSGERRDRLWSDAGEAMGGRRFGEAARHYEALLRELPKGDPATMSVRLDLARIYRQHLNDPERAIGHLRSFVTTWPEDVAAPSAVQELCRMLADADQRDALCIGR